MTSVNDHDRNAFHKCATTTITFGTSFSAIDAFSSGVSFEGLHKNTSKTKSQCFLLSMFISIFAPNQIGGCGVCVCVCVRLAEDFFVLTLVSHIALRGRVKDIGVCVKCACAAGVPVDSFIHFVWDMACAGHRIGLSLPFYLIPLRSFFQITFTCPVIPAATARATAPTTTVTLALLWRRCLHSTALGSGYDDCSQQESSLNQYQAQSTVPIKKALVEQKNKFFV